MIFRTGAILRNFPSSKTGSAYALKLTISRVCYLYVLTEMRVCVYRVAIFATDYMLWRIHISVLECTRENGIEVLGKSLTRINAEDHARVVLARGRMIRQTAPSVQLCMVAISHEKIYYSQFLDFKQLGSLLCFSVFSALFDINLGINRMVTQLEDLKKTGTWKISMGLKYSRVFLNCTHDNEVFFKIYLSNYGMCRGESAALGRRMPWTNRLFSKSMKRKILNFLHEGEKMISVISGQVSSKKLDFPSLKKIDLTFKRQK